MNLFIYISDDYGLLSEKLSLFLSEHKTTNNLINPTIDEIKQTLFQQKILDNSENYIINEFQSNINDLLKYLSFFKDKKFNMIITIISSQKIFIQQNLKQLISNNPYLYLSKWNQSKRKEYIETTCKNKNINLSKGQIDLIYKNKHLYISDINDLLSQLCILSKSKDLIDNKTIKSISAWYNKNFFILDFFDAYIFNDSKIWVSFLNQKRNLELINNFSYQAIDFYWNSLNDLNNLKIPAKYMEIYIQNKEIINKYIRLLILNLLIFKKENLIPKSIDIKLFFIFNNFNNHLVNV